MSSFWRETVWTLARYLAVAVSFLPWSLAYGFLAAGGEVRPSWRFLFVLGAAITGIPVWRWSDRIIAARQATVVLGHSSDMALPANVYRTMYRQLSVQIHVEQLPGTGPSTAGALSSFGYVVRRALPDRPRPTARVHIAAA